MSDERSKKDVEKTTLARLGVGRLPGDVRFVAGVGVNAAAPQTLNDKILRPTMGLRIISLGLSVVLVALMFWGPQDLWVPSPTLNFAVLALIAYAVLFLQTYEVRYDDHRIVYRGWRFQREEVLWRDVISIRDNSHYLYILRTETGKKIEIQKYLVGIADFVGYAQARIAQNP